MKTSRFDMAESCQEALRIFADSDKPSIREEVAQRWAALKLSAQAAMEACDCTKEEERMDHGALLLLLCAIETLEKHQLAASAEERTRLFMHGSRMLRSARLQHERG